MSMKFWFLAYACLLSSFFLVYHEWSRIPDGRLHVTMFDVEQGDALLIETPGNQRILIDGGPNLSLLEKLGDELPYFKRQIDLLVLSHPDADHITSLAEVLRRYDVKKVLMTGVHKDMSRYSAFLDALDESDAEIIIADANYDIDLGAGAMLDILWPRENMFGKEVKDTNKTSIVSKLIWKDHEILLTGDIDKNSERELLIEGEVLTADILTVPHHGSKTSSSTGFLLAVNPELALISVGRNNRYSHPHREVVSRYEKLNIPIKRTDLEGKIELEFR
jgi:competence protein ComEC